MNPSEEAHWNVVSACSNMEDFRIFEAICAHLTLTSLTKGGIGYTHATLSFLWCCALWQVRSTGDTLLPALVDLYKSQQKKQNGSAANLKDDDEATKEEQLH